MFHVFFFRSTNISQIILIPSSNAQFPCRTCAANLGTTTEMLSQRLCCPRPTMAGGPQIIGVLDSLKCLIMWDSPHGRLTSQNGNCLWQPGFPERPGTTPRAGQIGGPFFRESLSASNQDLGYLYRIYGIFRIMY